MLVSDLCCSLQSSVPLVLHFSQLNTCGLEVSQLGLQLFHSNVLVLLHCIQLPLELLQYQHCLLAIMCYIYPQCNWFS